MHKGDLERFGVADYKNVEKLVLQYFKCINENNGSFQFFLCVPKPDPTISEIIVSKSKKL
jgi:hypothetical protein